MLSQTAERDHLSSRRGRRAVWSLLMINLQHTDCQLMAGLLRAADPCRQPRSLLLRVWTHTDPARQLTEGPLSQSRGAVWAWAGPVGVGLWQSRVESPCQQRSASRFNEGRGKLWLEVFVCNHVTFPKRPGQRRQQIASDSTSRCLEMVLMLWIMSVGEQAARNADTKNNWVNFLTDTYIKKIHYNYIIHTFSNELHCSIVNYLTLAHCSFWVSEYVCVQEGRKRRYIIFSIYRMSYKCRNTNVKSRS